MEELLASLDSRALTRWMAYHRVEPWGAERDDLRALFLALAVNAPWAKGGGKLDFRKHFPHLFRRVPDQSPEEMMEIAKAWTRSHGGEVIGGD